MKTSYFSLLRRSRAVLLVLFSIAATGAFASSHREAPLISSDPAADNTDVYAFRSPDDTNTVTIICNWIPFQLPDAGPNYYTFSPSVRYEVHVKNNAATTGDDITYRFTFSQLNQDTTTFFNIRLGQRNLLTTYTCQRRVGAGTFVTIATDTVAPPNIGPRSIDGAAGLNAPYLSLFNNSISTASTGEQVFCGPVDDPFFVDLAGVFDLGNFRPNGNGINPPKDGLARYNVHTIALKIPIATLQKNGQGVGAATSILDPNYVIGVWASSSREQVRTLTGNNAQPVGSGNFVQVSRLGMPLTNEAVIPIGDKDRYNAIATGANATDARFAKYFANPELALYMSQAPGHFGSAVPALNDLRIQGASRPDLIAGGFDFRNGAKGLFPLKGSPLLNGTALAAGPSNGGSGFGDILLPDSMSPRAVDILPIFYTGVPNLPPYQLATGKTNLPSTTTMNPLSAGKPFINNFLPTLGDMLRLNMAVPVTQRTDPKFSSLGLIQAAVLGLTDPAYNTNANLQFIPNMDGFPNGRRLEDDVTTIELQAVSGAVLAAIGLWYDDYNASAGNPLTPQLLRVVGFTAGVTKNDTTLRTAFPYVQLPWRGYDFVRQARF
ncbi:MAG: DUF4331 domain-containing protein [Sphingobacteriales bacterium]|nr:MAG: DUF4331 domain-containing protein [Sphingobacteriales bacterium]